MWYVIVPKNSRGNVKALAHGYRPLQQFNQWLTQYPLGLSILEAEEQMLSYLLKHHLGKHALLIGVPQQLRLLHATALPCHTLISPLLETHKEYNFIESNFHELPLYTGSIDLVILPHILEFVDNPRQLLAEACRVIKPEGLIVICGFNPLSAWGIRKIFTRHKVAPWSGNFFHPNKIKKWLQLADFVMEQQKLILFRPPVSHTGVYQKLGFMEFLGSHFFPPLGGVYILLSRAKVIPLTPIRMQWKQPLSGLRISSTITGHIARSSK